MDVRLARSSVVPPPHARHHVAQSPLKVPCQRLLVDPVVKHQEGLLRRPELQDGLPTLPRLPVGIRLGVQVLLPLLGHPLDIVRDGLAEGHCRLQALGLDALRRLLEGRHRSLLLRLLPLVRHHVGSLCAGSKVPFLHPRRLPPQHPQPLLLLLLLDLQKRVRLLSHGVGVLHHELTLHADQPCPTTHLGLTEQSCGLFQKPKPPLHLLGCKSAGGRRQSNHGFMVTIMAVPAADTMAAVLVAAALVSLMIPLSAGYGSLELPLPFQPLSLDLAAAPVPLLVVVVVGILGVGRGPHPWPRTRALLSLPR